MQKFVLRFLQVLPKTHSVILCVQLGDLSPSKWVGLSLGVVVLFYTTAANSQKNSFMLATKTVKATASDNKILIALIAQLAFPFSSYESGYCSFVY